MKRDKSEVRVFVRMPFYLKTSLLRMARKEKVSIAEIVRRAVTHFRDNNKK